MAVKLVDLALQCNNVQATLDCLGENVTSPKEAEGSRDAYLAALDQIESQGMHATVSIKLTQLAVEGGDDRYGRVVFGVSQKLGSQIWQRVKVNHGRRSNINLSGTEISNKLDC